jgi:predicted DNA-binding protein
LRNRHRLIKKFFPLDKNYLLEQAQLRLREKLLLRLVDKVKSVYEYKINPLGLTDAFTLKIRTAIPAHLHLLHNFYDTLAAVYRLKHGDNQLQFLWDGTDHSSHYEEAWSEKFEMWTHGFCQHELFIQAVLDLTIFLSDDQPMHMIENRMNHFVLKHLEVKVHKAKGLMVA